MRFCWLTATHLALMEINERAHQYEQGQIGVEEGIIYKKITTDRGPDLSSEVHPSHDWFLFRASLAWKSPRWSKGPGMSCPGAPTSKHDQDCSYSFSSIKRSQRLGVNGFQKLLNIKFSSFVKRDSSPKNKETQICWAGHNYWTHWRHTHLGLFPHGLALITHFLSALIGGRWNLGQTSYPGSYSQKSPCLDHISLFSCLL